MKLRNVYPLVQLPSRTELLLYLIKEDLKSCKFFNGLRKVGLDDSWYQSDLGTLILAYAGLDSEEDAISNFYYKLLGQYSENLVEDRESLMENALQVYIKLMEKKGSEK